MPVSGSYRSFIWGIIREERNWRYNRKEEGSRKQKRNGSFCFEALGKEEKLWERKPEPQKLASICGGEGN